MSGMNPVLYPNVTRLPGSGGLSDVNGKGPSAPKPGEFQDVLSQVSDLSQVREPLKFSAHAMQRLKDRKIQVGAELMSRLNEAVDKAAAKGVEESLILTKDSALIVSVPNRTVITALDRSQMNGNVFTNIDGAVIVD